MTTSNTTQNPINHQEPKPAATSDQLQDLLDISLVLLCAAANFESEPSTIEKVQYVSEFMSDHKKKSTFYIRVV